MHKATIAAIAACLLLLFSACGSEEGGATADSGSNADYPSERITVYSYVEPGGGPDAAIQGIIDGLRESGTVDVPMRLDNLPGGSGLVATATLAGDFSGSDAVMMLGTASPLAATIQDPDSVGLDQMTPIAQIFAEYTYAYVGADSPYESMSDVGDALKEDPGSVVVGGGSLGSADNVVVAQFANDLGVAWEDVKYIPLTGDEQASQLLGGQVDINFGGPEQLDLVESGDTRVLAVSAPERVADVPTFVEQGFEGVTQTNWRGLFGPPEMPQYAVDYWSEKLMEMVETPEWEAIAKERLWDTTGLDHGEFEAFLAEEEESMRAVMTELGLLSN